MRYAVVMAGGAGTRLWPMSRAALPKQLLPIIKRPGADEPVTLIELAAKRMDGVVDDDKQLICTGARYAQTILEAVPGWTRERILPEPTGRDTLNAVGFAAAVLAKEDPDAVFIVLTADHIIEPAEVFAKRAELAFKIVEDDPRRLLTFSIKPTHAATGFGYIERGRPLGAVEGDQGLAFGVTQFVEKPPLHKAQAYVESGMFAWNAGMFVFHARTFMECLKEWQPESHEGLTKIADAWGTDEQDAVLDEVYPTLPKVSVDYGVMEPASNDSRDAKERVSICTVVTEVDWLDVGSWPSYGETVEGDAEGNKAGAQMRADKLVAHEANGNLVVSDDSQHTVALLGVDDLIVVHTKDATLIMPADKAQALKELHGKLPEELK